MFIQRFALWLALAACTVLPPHASERSPSWYTDLDKALAEAKASDRVVLMEVNGRPWCPPCNLQEQNLINTDAFRSWSKQFVLLDIKVGDGYNDSDGNPIWRALMKKHGLQGIPSVVFLAADGSALGKLGPNPDAQTWIELADEILRKETGHVGAN